MVAFVCRRTEEVEFHTSYTGKNMTAVFKHISDEPDSAANQTSAAESVTGESQYSGMYVICKNQYQRMKHFVWLSTPVLVADLMTDCSENVHEVVPDIHESASWRSMSGLLQMLLGTWPVTTMSVGRNNPSLVKRCSE